MTLAQQPTRGSDLHLDCDVVVVGSGASGAVVATELALAGQDVVVLEEGDDVTGVGEQRRSVALRRVWRDGGLTAALGLGNTPTITLAVGRGVGGSSLLTGGVCFRTPDRVLNGWVQERGLRELTPKGLEPAFEAVERAMGVAEVMPELRSRSTTLFDAGARKLGYPLKPLLRNMQNCNGCSRCNFVCPHGAKQSVDRSYLPRALAAGARIFSRCLVQRVDTHGDRAVGVSGRLLGESDEPLGGHLTVRAKRVVLASGALHTPLLLMRSGIGRSSHQVGRNLTLHPGCRVYARFDEPVESWKGAMQSAYTDAFEHEGLTLISIVVPPSIFAATVFGSGPDLHRRAAVVSQIAMFGGMLHDAAGGRVRRGLGREPIVTYRMSDRDRARVPRLLTVLAETFFAAGAREVHLPIIGHDPVDADAFRRMDLTKLPLRRLECASQHPLGSCRMGASPSDSVVGPSGETWDLRELFVVDGSIVPTSLGVNPQVSIMALATHLAWKLRERPLTLRALSPL